MKGRYCLLVALVSSLNLSSALAIQSNTCAWESVTGFNLNTHLNPTFDHQVFLSTSEYEMATSWYSSVTICPDICGLPPTPCFAWTDHTQQPISHHPGGGGFITWVGGPLPSYCSGLYYQFESNITFIISFQYQDPQDPFGTWYTYTAAYPNANGLECPYYPAIVGQLTNL